MTPIYLTPASISFLTQFILSLTISVFLIRRLWKQRTLQLALLTGFFTLATTFIGLMFLDAAFSPYLRLLVVYAENTILALGLVFLIQFAYRFPQQYPQRKWESYAALLVSLAYFTWEGGYMVYRYVSLFGQETVYFRPYFAAYSMAFVLLLAPIAFLRQSIAADARSTNARPVSWVRKLWKPEGKGARGARGFVVVFGILFVLGVSNVLLIFRLPHTIYNAAMSIGILAALWLFATNYINFIPGGVSVQVKLSVLTLTFFLALLGSVGWLIAPPYIATFQPNLTDHQTLRFTPNAAGSYAVTEIDFQFEENLGEKIHLGITEETRSQKIEFTFPFFGRSYTDIYLVGCGVVTFGEPFWHPNMQAVSANIPMILPLLIDLDPDPATGDGGVYFRTEPERLILTWNRVPALYQREALFTFQAVLYSDGVFEFTYNGLPLPIIFDPDAAPSANPWLRGAVSGQGETLHTNADDLLTSAQSGTSPLLENYQLAFRRYLHTFMLPVGWVVVGGSLLLLLAVPLLLRYSIVRPLESLTAGVRAMEAGNLDIELPIPHDDEVGFLTGAFNSMTARIKGLVTGLEEQVAVRTFELSAANQTLRAEMEAREKTQTQILEQGKELVVLEERSRLSRDLHDGLGQVLSYINIQSGVIQSMLERRKIAEAQANLAQLIEAARNAATDLQVHLLGLRQKGKSDTLSAQADLFETLSAYLTKFQARHGLEIHFWPPENLNKPLFPSNVEEQALRIIQESLTNIVKHAQASRAEIDFQVSDEAVQISITDDGIGMRNDEWRMMPAESSTDALSPIPGHFGLQIMRERAEAAGGQLDIRSMPGEGTRVSLRLPRFLPNADHDDSSEIRGLRIVLADDHPLFLGGLRNLLTSRGLTVIGTAQNGQEAIEMVRALKPDVALLDLNMPECDGIEATKAIKAEMPEVKVVILTIPESEDHLYAAIRAGASGYLYKDLDPNQLCKYLAGVMRGEAALSPGIAERMMADLAQEKHPAVQAASAESSDPAVLTPRQWEVLQMAADGLIYKEIGAALGIAEKTVKYHIGQIIERLHVENRAQAIAHFHQKRGK